MNGPLPRVPARVESPLRPPRDLRAVALACAFAGALLAARFAWTGGLGFAFLLWNLALALAPLALALPARGGAPRFVAWLLFFPNAPYLVTDFVHLGAGDAPLWFDVGLLAAFAWAGLLAGCVSLERMRGRVEARWGARAGWLFAAGAAGLAGFGIWLGRFVRLNSWDVVARPGPLLDALAAPLVDPLGSARAWAVTLLFGAFLFVVHAGLRAGREARPAR